MGELILVLGGAKCGKTKFALEEANKCNREKIYLATAENLDNEMNERIRKHKLERGFDWETLELPIEVSEGILNLKGEKVILLDCLTLWLSNLLFFYKEDEDLVLKKLDSLIEAIDKYKGPIIIVSNDVSGGIVPLNEIARKFRDLAGTANQKLAKLATDVYFITAGLPLKLK